MKKAYTAFGISYLYLMKPSLLLTFLLFLCIPAFAQIHDKPSPPPPPVRVLMMMPNWKPARSFDGKPVESRFIMPVKFVK
jgi:hypothetical protein